MKNFLYKLFLMPQGFTRAPFHYPRRVQFCRYFIFGFGFYWSIGKKYLRQGIGLQLPFLLINFYLHSMKKAQEIYYKNNPI